jgi:outer membrane protein OmpA-like peptidoglycan-associated protein
MSRIITSALFLIVSNFAFAQKVTIDGYVFEKYNRGFLNDVIVTVLDKSEVLVAEGRSDIDGHFTIEVPAGKEYFVDFTKKIFKNKRETLSTIGKNAGESVYIKAEMERQPGYLLEVTLAEKRSSEDIPVDAVNGARIEIYNHTNKKMEMVIDSAKTPSFNITLQQGNEYTILVRRKDFYNKRLHANVNINGCYLCMDGFGTVNPGVVSNLTSAENNMLGTLIANVGMERIDTTRNIVIQNIYYSSNSADLWAEAKKELDKVITLLKNNPSLVVELGSHTDSRGSDAANKTLSQLRAQNAVNYILTSPWIEPSKLKAKGYGESKLVNECEDGTPCNDEKHQRNRRTELKIIGFTNDPYQDKSLLEIIHQEELIEFVNKGEGEKEYKAPTNSNTVDNSEFKQVPASEIQLPDVKQKNSTPSVPTPQNNEKVGSKQPQITDNQSNTTKPSGDIKASLKPIGDYSGYKIELFRVPTALTLEDPDIKMIAYEVSSDVFFDKLKTGETAYTVGYFQNWSETERFLEKVIVKYPKARIVDYFKGKRLGE